jgi:Api92-like protein with ferredoxin domain
MPNWCSNNIVVSGPVEEIAHFKETCIRRDEKGASYFDFNSLIPMPAIIKSTIVTHDDILTDLGPNGLIPHSLKERMEYSDVCNIEELREKIGSEALEKRGLSIEAFEQAGAPNWYVWANRNWGTKWNASDFKIVTEEPGRYEFRFETAWGPPEPVYVKLAETFPRLCFEISGGDDQLNFDFRGTGRDGTFNIQYEDPNKEGFMWGLDSET